VTVHAFNTFEFDSGALLIHTIAVRGRARAAGFADAAVAYCILFSIWT